MLILAAAAALIPGMNPKRIQTTDFVHFYAAASIVLHGDGPNLYDRATQDAAFQSVLGYRTNQYFLHPPFQAGAIAPFALLSFEHAYIVWTLINVAVIGLLPLILMECVPLLRRRPSVGLLAFGFPATLVSFALGQDATLLLVVLSLAYWRMREHNDTEAGLVLSLLAIKFQYLVIVGALLLFQRKFRLMFACAAGCLCLGLASVAVVGPHAIISYFRFIHEFEVHSGYGSANPTLMVNLRGFLAGLGYTRHWEVWTIVSTLTLLAWGFVCSRRALSRAGETLAFAFYVTGALLVAPYAHFSDMTMLLLPLLLALDYKENSGRKSLPVRLISLCCALIFIGPVLLMLAGNHYWWNSRIYLMFPSILLLALVLGAELFSRAAGGGLSRACTAEVADSRL